MAEAGSHLRHFGPGPVWQRLGPGLKLYFGWALLAIAAAVAFGGLNGESITRLLVLGFLGLQYLLRERLLAAFPRLVPRLRFLLLGLLLAAVVEGFHMISTPVFLSLRIGPSTPPAQALTYYGLDLLLTLPAYVAIFSLLWAYTCRYRYSGGQFLILMGLGQALGDGGLFYFINAPWMLVFLPYPMSNYHAINLLPYFATRSQIAPTRPVGLAGLTVLPAIMLCYFVCGALIKILGRAWGLE